MIRYEPRNKDKRKERKIQRDKEDRQAIEPEVKEKILNRREKEDIRAEKKAWTENVTKMCKTYLMHTGVNILHPPSINKIGKSCTRREYVIYKKMSAKDFISLDYMSAYLKHGRLFNVIKLDALFAQKYLDSLSE